jgi:hypothetical protein
MPRSTTVLQVFVASPSDVAEERETLEAIVAEVNRLRSTNSGIRLELVRWETHVRPGFGSDAQAVINAQIEDNYDIFLGIMWTRFGTPTPRAGSGTEEEFNRAFERFQRNSNAVSLLIYFKEAPVDPNLIDLDQLAAVRRFKQRVQELGGVYGTFQTLEEFQSLLRAHLASEITEWERHLTTSLAPEVLTTQVAPTTIEDANLVTEMQVDEDLGFLDYIETAEEQFVASTEAVNRIGEALQILGSRMNERTVQVNSLQRPDGSYDVHAARRVAMRTAQDMEQFVARVTVETPIMAEALQRGIQAFGSASSFALAAGESARGSLKEAVNNVAQMVGAMASSRTNLSDLRTIVAGLPRMQRDFNVAKRNTIAALERLLSEIDSGINLARTVEISMRRILADL